MNLSRRDFLRYCGLSAAALGLSATDLGFLQQALANPAAPSVVWLQGAGCVGCSISLLDRVSPTAPATTVADLLINSINLAYHPSLMSAAGESAVAAAQSVYNKGNYILVVEGGIPTAFGGAACFAWRTGGKDYTFMEVVKTYAAKAAAIVCVGTCAAWGGIPAAPPNPTGVVGVKTLTGKTTINIPGCPAHPDHVVWGIVQLLLGNAVPLDAYGRPSAVYGFTVHQQCPRNGAVKAEAFADDGHCLMDLGCRGPVTYNNCPVLRWNNGVSWCVQNNAPCIGCANPDFPTAAPFYSGVGRGVPATDDRSGDSTHHDD